MKKLNAICIVILIVIILSSCSKQPENQIIGKWIGESNYLDYPLIIEFEENSRGNIVVPRGKIYILWIIRNDTLQTVLFDDDIDTQTILFDDDIDTLLNNIAPYHFTSSDQFSYPIFSDTVKFKRIIETQSSLSLDEMVIGQWKGIVSFHIQGNGNIYSREIASYLRGYYEEIYPEARYVIESDGSVVFTFNGNKKRVSHIKWQGEIVRYEPIRESYRFKILEINENYMVTTKGVFFKQ